MAINPNDRYSDQTTAPSADYPYGGARNQSVPGDNTGTPLEADLVNDIFGFQQALLTEAGIAPSGDPETAQDSQYLDALKQLFHIRSTGYILKDTKVFSAPGSVTYNKPAGVRAVKVTVVGGGGGGGGGDGTLTQAWSGGGGGGMAVAWVTSLGASEAVVVGDGGVGGTTFAGGSGGASSFGSYCEASGGSGAGLSNGGNGGAGVTGSVLVSGSDGGNGTANAVFSGDGGASPMGGSARGVGGVGSDGEAGRAGKTYGGGGSGASTNSDGGTPRIGGAGAAGVVIVEEYV